MRQAARLLQDQQIGTTTQQAEHAAIDRLALILAAMAPEELENPPPGNNVSNGGGGPNMVRDGPSGADDKRPARGMIMLAEVKFVKLWQEDLNRRTQQLELDAAGKPRDLFREQYDELTNEQARLAAAAIGLLKPAKAEPQ